MSLKTGLTNYYNLDGNSVDIISANNGTDSNVTYVAGKIKQAASFNGTNSKIRISNPLLASEGSMSIWVYHNSSGALSRIYSDEGGYVYFEQNSSGGSNNISWIMFSGSSGLITSTTYTINTWTHYVATWKSGGNIILYKNGIQAAILNSPVIAIIATFSSFGAVSAIRYFSGLIDEVAIYNRQISSTEVSALYNSGAGITYPFESKSSNFLPFFI